MDVKEIAEIIVADAVKHCGEELSLIACCGSYATGTATEGSDFDFFYIPVEGRRPDAARSVVVDGVTFDFWPIPWETAERIAEGRFRQWAVAPSLLLNASPLWSRSEEDVTRLERLKDRIRRSDPERVDRGRAHLAEAVRRLGELRSGGWRVVTACIESLALFNQVTFDGGWAKAIESLDRLAVKPEGLEERIRTIVTTSHHAKLLAASEQLVAGTARCIGGDSAEPESLRDEWAEFHEHLQKLETACAKDDALRASLECWLLSDELARFRGVPLPDLVAAFDAANLDGVAQMAREIRRRIHLYLEGNGLATYEFANAAELTTWLAERRRTGPASV